MKLMWMRRTDHIKISGLFFLCVCIDHADLLTTSFTFSLVILLYLIYILYSSFNRIKHTYILDDPFDDPPQLVELIPEASPEGKPKDEVINKCRMYLFIYKKV